MTETRRKKLAWGCSVLLLLFAAGIFLLLPSVSTSREHARALVCKHGHLQAIGLALYNYHDDYDSLPPAYVTDASGKHRHSWRVLLLPYLDHQELYDEYRFNEAWDSEPNREVVEKLDNFSTFRCPSDSSSDDNSMETSYLAVMGEQTAWNGKEPVSFDDIEDDREETILVVEVHNSGVHWAEPRDLSWVEMNFRINDFSMPSLRSRHKTDAKWFWEKGKPFVHALMADGSVKRIRPETSPEVMKALLTIRGGEKDPDVREFE